jgi:hypothetical protein
VLFGSGASQRLKPVREVRGALLKRPVLHRRGDHIGELGVQHVALLDGGLQPLEDVRGEPVALHRSGEHVLAERVRVLSVRYGAVGAPTGGFDVTGARQDDLAPGAQAGTERGEAEV